MLWSGLFRTITGNSTDLCQAPIMVSIYYISLFTELFTTLYCILIIIREKMKQDLKVFIYWQYTCNSFHLSPTLNFKPQQPTNSFPHTVLSVSHMFTNLWRPTAAIIRPFSVYLDPVSAFSSVPLRGCQHRHQFTRGQSSTDCQRHTEILWCCVFPLKVWIVVGRWQVTTALKLCWVRHPRKLNW